MDINELIERVVAVAEQDTWIPEEEYSVFNQWDKEYYCSQREEFTHKYRVFKAISSVLQPGSITELGTHGGSGADAYLSGVDYNASYTGYDTFGMAHDKDGNEWPPADRCKLLFEARKFNRYNLIECDLRQIEKVAHADLAIVDAEHDYRNCYQDLLLCLESRPKYIHIDDYPGQNNLVHNAVEDFAKNYRENVAGYGYIPHVCGSGIIKMKYNDT
jgi:hypothetical protein